MKPRVLFALIVLTVLVGMAIFMVIPASDGDQGQQQVQAVTIMMAGEDGNTLAINADNDAGILDNGNILAVVPNANVGHDPDILNTCNIASNTFDDGYGTKTPGDIDKGVLANAGAEVCDAVCIIMTQDTDNNLVMRNVPIDKVNPDGGRAIMANSADINDQGMQILRL
ncbi:hypothetical protein HY624_02415 [Candidatus Uhrbacteria bacterium]|nr:hypothetical protein [Candidatus Uhrbacteria bacterium]